MKQSHLVTKTRKVLSEQEASINAQLLERGGYIAKLMAGVYSYLPLGLQVLTAIETIVRQELSKLGAEEILMPALQPKENWVKTGRWDTVDILYKLEARDQELCLGPTHEEVVTPLMTTFIQSYKDLPCSVYQIQTKYRNEARPKSGLLRGREFRMNDLYSFHVDQDSLDCFYEQVQAAYCAIFNRCGLGSLTYLTYASGGVFSKYSHEYQTITPYGEDIIYVCSGCKVAINREIIEDQKACPSCAKTALEEQKAIEVGNIFKLSTRFAEAFGLTYTDSQDKRKTPIMGCYGIGTSRLMGAIVETLHDDRGIIWPLEIAPYKIHIVLLSKTQVVIEQASQLYNHLQKEGMTVLLDDRAQISAGEKFADADLLGMPWRLVISDKTFAQEVVECKARSRNDSVLIPLESVLPFFEAEIQGKTS